MTIAQITKTYKMVLPDGRRCSSKKVEMYRNLSAPSEYDTRPCDDNAVLCIDIATITTAGRRRTNRIGFCELHIPMRYIRWFGNSKYTLQKTELLNTIRRATELKE